MDFNKGEKDLMFTLQFEPSFPLEQRNRCLEFCSPLRIVAQWLPKGTTSMTHEQPKANIEKFLIGLTYVL